MFEDILASAAAAKVNLPLQHLSTVTELS